MNHCLMHDQAKAGGFETTQRRRNAKKNRQKGNANKEERVFPVPIFFVVPSFLLFFFLLLSPHPFALVLLLFFFLLIRLPSSPFSSLSSPSFFFSVLLLFFSLFLFFIHFSSPSFSSLSPFLLPLFLSRTFSSFFLVLLLFLSSSDATQRQTDTQPSISFRHCLHFPPIPPTSLYLFLFPNPLYLYCLHLYYLSPSLPVPCVTLYFITSFTLPPLLHLSMPLIAMSAPDTLLRPLSLPPPFHGRATEGIILASFFLRFLSVFFSPNLLTPTQSHSSPPTPTYPRPPPPVTPFPPRSPPFHGRATEEGIILASCFLRFLSVFFSPQPPYPNPKPPLSPYTHLPSPASPVTPFPPRSPPFLGRVSSGAGHVLEVRAVLQAEGRPGGSDTLGIGVS
ncbi:hypothetical protein C7M84_006870 [Penaeus vannamei]|uniref:Uncharacterized protein n=1 Tax=Penaeus vannamei TaxID=6689 RepID=A0A423TDP5_PENVA|nr:hypothetical protein C7M84_006870 [Penaeus vannamei]